MMSRWLLLLPYVGLVAGYSVLIALALGSVTGELAEVLYGAIALTALVLFRQAARPARQQPPAR